MHRLNRTLFCREHFAHLGIQRRLFFVDNPWFSGNAYIGTYMIEELLGTKLRALYQRKKGRDLYDLWLALTLLEVEDDKVIDCFNRYLEHEGLAVSRAEFEDNLNNKLRNRSFWGDIQQLLPRGVSYNITEAAPLVSQRLITHLRGDAWKGSDNG
jgi:hypothetical protein